MIATLVLSVLSAAPLQAAKTSSPTPARALIAQGKARLQANDYGGAIRRFIRATHADPNSAEAFFQLGNACYRRAYRKGTPESAELDTVWPAVEAYETALRIDPSLKSVSDPAGFHLGHGLCQLALNNAARALGSFQTAMRLTPFDPMPALYAARARYALRDFGNSSTNFELSLRRARRTRSYPSLAQRVRTDPMFAGLTQLPQNRAMLRIYDEVEKGRMSEAQARIRLEEMAAYRDTLRDAPRSDVRRRFEPTQEAEIQALIEAGIRHRKTGRLPESIEALRRAATEDPESHAAYYQMALTYSISQDFPKALGALGLALRNATSPAELRKALLLARVDSEFDSLRKYPAFSKLLARHARRLTRRR